MKQKSRHFLDAILGLWAGATPLLVRVLDALFGQKISGQRKRDIEPDEIKGEDTTLDPIVFAGLLSSIITIASALRGNGQRVFAQDLVVRFMEKRARAGSIEATMPVDVQDVAKIAEIVASIHLTDQKFLDRINATCLKDFHDIVDDYTKPHVEAYDSYETTRYCVCTNLKIVRKMNQGRLPPAFRELWDRYGCTTL